VTRRQWQYAFGLGLGLLLLQGCAAPSATDLAKDEARSAIADTESALVELRSEAKSNGDLVRSLTTGKVAYPENLIGAPDSELLGRSVSTPYSAMVSATAENGNAEVLIVSIGKGEHSEGGFYKKAYVYLCVQLTQDGSPDGSWEVTHEECPSTITTYLAVPREAILVKLQDLNYTSPVLNETK
jgi:hypothetical protein